MQTQKPFTVNAAANEDLLEADILKLPNDNLKLADEILAYIVFLHSFS